MNIEKYAVSTRNGKKYTIGYRHPFFGNFIMKIDARVPFDNFDELEDSVLKLAKLYDVICVDCKTGDILVVNKNIISESMIIIRELK